MSGTERTDAVTPTAATLESIYPSLRRFAAVAGSADVAPDDLVHDAIVAVLRSGKFDQLDDPASYLKRAIVNLASNERRRLGRGRRALLRAASESSGEARDAYPSDLSHLAALSPRARSVLYLHYVEGESFEQIAAVVGRRASSVRQIATRARRQLRVQEEESE